MYQHCIRVNDNHEITQAFSSAFQDPLASDIILETTEERHFHLQLIDPVTGDLRLLWENGQIVEKTPAELLPAPTITFTQRISGQSVSDELRRSAAQQCDDRLAPLLKAGFTYTDGVVYQADDEMRNNMMGFMIMFMAGQVSTVQVRTLSNHYTEFDKTSFPVFTAFLFSFVQSTYQRIWQAKDIINTAQTIDQVVQALQSVGVQ